MHIGARLCHLLGKSVVKCTKVMSFLIGKKNILNYGVLSVLLGAVIFLLVSHSVLQMKPSPVPNRDMFVGVVEGGSESTTPDKIQKGEFDNILRIAHLKKSNIHEPEQMQLSDIEEASNSQIRFKTQNPMAYDSTVYITVVTEQTMKVNPF